MDSTLYQIAKLPLDLNATWIISLYFYSSAPGSPQRLNNHVLAMKLSKKSTGCHQVRKPHLTELCCPQ